MISETAIICSILLYTSVYQHLAIIVLWFASLEIIMALLQVIVELTMRKPCHVPQRYRRFKRRSLRHEMSES